MIDGRSSKLLVIARSIDNKQKDDNKFHPGPKALTLMCISFLDITLEWTSEHGTFAAQVTPLYPRCSSSIPTHSAARRLSLDLVLKGSLNVLLYTSFYNSKTRTTSHIIHNFLKHDWFAAVRLLAIRSVLWVYKLLCTLFLPRPKEKARGRRRYRNGRRAFS